MRTRQFLLRLAVVACAATASTHASSGIWTNLNGGSWTNAANWNAAAIASGSGSTANFTTLNLPADVSVTLDAPQAIGNLSFDDQNPAKHNWLLHPGSAGSLTLAGGTPTITVVSATTAINMPIGRTAGLTKAGAGRLVLSGANTYSGTTTVSAGILGLA